MGRLTKKWDEWREKTNRQRTFYKRHTRRGSVGVSAWLQNIKCISIFTHPTKHETRPSFTLLGLSNLPVRTLNALSSQVAALQVSTDTRFNYPNNNSNRSPSGRTFQKVTHRPLPAYSSHNPSPTLHPIPPRNSPTVQRWQRISFPQSCYQMRSLHRPETSAIVEWDRCKDRSEAETRRRARGARSATSS